MRFVLPYVGLDKGIPTTAHLAATTQVMQEPLGLTKSLLDKISVGKDSTLILISGPADSGKTIAVCQWIRRDRLRVAWYGVSEVKPWRSHLPT